MYMGASLSAVFFFFGTKNVSVYFSVCIFVELFLDTRLMEMCLAALSSLPVVSSTYVRTYEEGVGDLQPVFSRCPPNSTYLLCCFFWCRRGSQKRFCAS